MEVSASLDDDNIDVSELLMLSDLNGSLLKHHLALKSVGSIFYFYVALGGRYRLSSTGSADYVLPRTRTKFRERGFSYCGPVAWNTFSSDLHNITDADTFRKRLKSVLFDRAYH